MSSNNSNSSGGILLPLLTVLFIYLKLTGTIDWSWLWVLSPIWIPIVIALVIIVGMLVVSAILENK